MFSRNMNKIAQARSLLLGQPINENENAKRKASVFFNINDKSASGLVSSWITIREARLLLL